MSTTPPIVRATIQAAILSAISNTLAQLISCHRAGEPYTLNTEPLVTFVVYSLFSCPPNFLWQQWLESAFPGYTAPDEPGSTTSIARDPTVKAATEKAAPAIQILDEKASAATTALNDTDVVKTTKKRASERVEGVKAKAKELEERAGISTRSSTTPPATKTFSTADGNVVEKTDDGTTLPPSSSPSSSSQKKLNVKNTAIKFAMDQSFGAVLNNAMFIAGICLLKGGSFDAVIAALRKDFLPLLFAGQKLWPLVSIISFTLVPVEKRTVFGGIVGVGWGIFLSLIVANPGGKKKKT